MYSLQRARLILQRIYSAYTLYYPDLCVQTTLVRMYLFLVIDIQWVCIGLPLPYNLQYKTTP